MRVQFALLAVLSTAFISCRSSHWVSVSDNRSKGVLLASSEDEDGTRRAWRVYPGNRHQPRIDVSSSTVRVVSRIGLSVSAVTRERSEYEGVEPWKGVWIDHAQAGSPAARVGIVRGDIVLKVAGQDVASAEQFADIIAQHAKPAEELELTLRVHRQRGKPIGTTVEPAVVTIVPEAVEVRDSHTDSIPLDHSVGVLKYTGLQAATVPPDVARSIYSVNEPTVLVTGIITGSPAYYAGFRAGDRVTRVDGQTVSSLQDLRDAVYQRIRTENPTAPTFDLSDGTTSAQPRNGDIAIEAIGPLGPHGASVEITDDIDDRTEFHIPIVVDYGSRVDRSDTSFLDFIFQFGFNYESRARPSATREPVETWELSLFPLGMFEFEKGVDHSEYTFFWFITFETGR